MPQPKYVYVIDKIGVNIDLGAVPQDYYFRALSIDGGFWAFGNGINAAAGDFAPAFVALGAQKLRGTGERTGDPGDERIEKVTSVAGDILGLRLPADYYRDTVCIEIWADKPW
jgi:hypothetical protein